MNIYIVNSVLALISVTGLSVAQTVDSANAGQPAISLTLATTSTSVAMHLPIRLTISLTNVSNNDVSVSRLNGRDLDGGFDVHAIDEQGAVVLPTPYFTEITERLHGKREKGSLMALQPGKSIVTHTHLAYFYKSEHPGGFHCEVYCPRS